jgi:hypothetical protein
MMTTPTEDQMRAEFEAWAKDSLLPDTYDLSHNGIVYNKPMVAMAYAGWQAARQARQGWWMVPVEPTEAMHVAAVHTIVRCKGNHDFPPRVWRAMLAAAPSPQDGNDHGN